MKKTKNQKGITLISLVITIIILLILAGISISMLTGEGGIIKQATNASLANRAGTVDEEVKLWKTEWYIYNTVGWDTQPISENEFLQKLQEENLVKQEEINKETEVITIGDKTISYGEDVTGQLASRVLKPGDYVQYEVPIYQDSFTNNNYIDTTTYQGDWIVLYNDTIFGTQIVSKNCVGTLKIGYSTGSGSYTETVSQYNNCMNIFEQYCSKYLNTDLTTRARTVGEKADFGEDTTEVGEGYGGLSPKISDNNYENDVKRLTDIGILNIGESYWLGSRNTIYQNNTVNLYIRKISAEGLLDSNYLGYKQSGSSNAYVIEDGVRPVFLLKEGLTILSGRGTQTNPYVLQ